MMLFYEHSKSCEIVAARTGPVSYPCKYNIRKTVTKKSQKGNKV
jgi:hypothetical protein